MPKVLRVAGEVDGWCTRCRLVLNHRIVSMDGGKPHQVECLTCRSQHRWRARAPGDKVAPTERAERRSSGAGPTSHAPRVASATRLEQQWQKSVLGHAMTDFKAYSVGASFNEGDLIRHKKFGDGVVIRVIDAAKVEVLFRDETRTLAQGMS
ncbi:MAG: hypothetical protein ABTD50_14350 [Polyangiaceae bacterium]